MWEQGLPAMGWHVQHRCKLSHRHREQAQLPQRICAEGRICAPPSRFNVGARLARDGGGTFNIAASCPTAIASKLSSHRGFVLKAGSVPFPRDSMWEQGLPAMGGGTFNIAASCPTAIASKLSSHRGFVVKAGSVPLLRDSMWEQGLPAMGWHIQHRCKLSHRHREQAQLPQRICAEGRICALPSRFNVGARLARDGGWHIQHRCKLSHRHREQAQLPQRICAEGRICEHPASTSGFVSWHQVWGWKA